MIAMVWTLALGCGGSAKPPAEPAPVAEPAAAAPTGEGAPAGDAVDVAAVIARFEAYATEMCACTDKACGEMVNASLQAYTEAMDRKPPPRQLAQAEEKQMVDAATRYGECQSKLP